MLFYPKNIAFGLDIGDKSIKIAEVKFIKNIKGNSFLVLTATNEISVPEGLIINGEIKNPPAVADLINKCAKRVKGRYLSAGAVVASLPETQCYLKTIAAPKQGNESVTEFVKRSISKHFPLSAEQVYFDYSYINENTLLVGIAPKNIVDSFTNVIEQAGLVPLSLEIEGLAIARALTDIKSPEDSAKTKIFMDLGATRSSIIAAYNNAVVLTLNIPLSGDAMTREIAKTEKVSFEEAEKIKIGCGFDPAKCPTKTKKIIASIVKSTAEEIKKGLKYVSASLPSKTDKIFICGGVSTMSKLSTELSEKFNMKVRHGDPGINIRLGKRVGLTSDELLKYTTAIGLAIRGTEADLLNIEAHKKIMQKKYDIPKPPVAGKEK